MYDLMRELLKLRGFFLQLEFVLKAHTTGNLLHMMKSSHSHSTSTLIHSLSGTVDTNSALENASGYLPP